VHLTKENIVIQKDFENITMMLYKNGIMNVIFKDNRLITIKDIEEVNHWVGSLGNRQYLNLMEGGYNTDIDSIVREFSASDKENKYTIADAMVISTSAHKLITDFYVKVNRPYKPTRVFTDRNEAIDWLLSLKHE
jgi:hypothetical protein